MKYFILPVLGLLAILLTSCSEENPVTTEPIFDEPRFEWQVTRMPGFTNGEWCYSFWSPDTNEVFMCSINNYLLHYKDGSFNRIDYGANIGMFSIDGISKTEGYIVGAEIINGKYVPHIEKWNGSTFVNMPVNYSFNDNFTVSHIFVKSSSEIWISGPKGRIYKFDGYNLKHFLQADTMMFSEGILYDENNKLRHLTTYFGSGDTVDKWFVYEFDGSNWNKVYQDNVYPKDTKFYGIMNNIIFAKDVKTIYKLNNNIIIPAININTNIMVVKAVYGTTFNNLMGLGVTSGRQTFFHYNGQKWSDENIGMYLPVDYINGEMVNENYFCGLTSGLINESYLFRAFKKNKDKNCE
jgi:hypothetical protein